MADNVQFQSTQLATPASGTTVSTDEAASGHIQRVKLAYSADGVDTHVTADASGLLVNTGAHLDAIHDAMALTDQAIAVKAAIFGHNSGGAGSYEPVKVTPSGALTVEVNDGGGSITVDGTVAATQSGTWNLNNIGGTISLPTGAATEYTAAQSGSNLAAVTSGSNLRVLGSVNVWGTSTVQYIAPAEQVTRSFNATSAQTGIELWAPTPGKRLAITNLQIGTYGTTAGRAIIWLGASGDTTYTEGTDQAVFKASFAPSTSAYPGAIVQFSPPFFAKTADHRLRITTDAALSIDVVVVGYEY